MNKSKPCVEMLTIDKSFVGLSADKLPEIIVISEEKDGSIEEYGLSNSGVKNVIVDLEVIPEGAFCNCTELETVICTSKLLKVSKRAFEGCISLKSIQLGDAIEEIDMMAFHGCVSLREINLSKTIRRVGEKAFKASTLISELRFEDKANVKIEKQAFEGCSGLQFVKLPYTSILEEEAFANCEALEVVRFFENTSIEFFNFGEIPKFDFISKVKPEKKQVEIKPEEIVEVKNEESSKETGSKESEQKDGEYDGVGYLYNYDSEEKPIIAEAVIEPEKVVEKTVENAKPTCSIVGIRVFSDCPSVKFDNLKAGYNVLSTGKKKIMNNKAQHALKGIKAFFFYDENI